MVSSAGKKELEEEVERLTAVIEQMGIPERDAFRAEVARLNAELPALRNEEQTLLASLTPMRAEAAQLAAERTGAEALRVEVASSPATRRACHPDRCSQHMSRSSRSSRPSTTSCAKGSSRPTRWPSCRRWAIYNYRHPLDDSPAYKAKLTGIQARIKDAVKAGSAVHGSTTWTVNGSSARGRQDGPGVLEAHARAYNNEADDAGALHEALHPGILPARLDKARETISKLGGTMNIRITDPYHRLRVEELELTADYLAKVAEEKERDREVRAQLREEEIATARVRARAGAPPQGAGPLRGHHCHPARTRRP